MVLDGAGVPGLAAAVCTAMSDAATAIMVVVLPNMLVSRGDGLLDAVKVQDVLSLHFASMKVRYLRWLLPDLHVYELLCLVHDAYLNFK